MLGKIIQNLDKAKSMTVFSFSVMLKLCLIDLKKIIISLLLYIPAPRSRVQGTQLFVVQSLSRVQLLVTPWTAAHQASLSFTISHSLLKLMSIE